MLAMGVNDIQVIFILFLFSAFSVSLNLFLNKKFKNKRIRPIYITNIHNLQNKGKKPDATGSMAAHSVVVYGKIQQPWI